MEQSANSRPDVPRVSQSKPNAHSDRADSGKVVQVAQVKRAARAVAREERAVPRVPTIARANHARQI